MRIALIGATGRIGRAVLDEALAGRHAVRALLRPGRETAGLPAHASPCFVDVFDAAALALALVDVDALVSAYRMPAMEAHDRLPELTAALVLAAQRTGIGRLITVGGSGMLGPAAGRVQDQATPAEVGMQLKVKAHADAVGVLRGSASSLQWTCVEPPRQIGASPGTGQWRSDVGRASRDAGLAHPIGFADFAAALVDELAQGRYQRQVMAVGGAA